MRFEYEKPSSYTNVYSGTGKGKTYFVKQFLKLYQDRDQERPIARSRSKTKSKSNNKKIIIVCKDERDWINPESGEPYSDFNMCDINMITSENMRIFQECNCS